MDESDPSSHTKNASLISQVRRLARTMHIAKRTEEAYVGWITRFLVYHRDLRGDWIHPLQLGSSDVNDFLSYLAVERTVAASTQNQALSALLFPYSKILKVDVKFDAIRAKRPSKLPVVMSPSEVVARSRFVEGILDQFPILGIELQVARVHAELSAELTQNGTTIGQHDLGIAATALHYKYAVMTTNAREFSRIQDLEVIPMDTTLPDGSQATQMLRYSAVQIEQGTRSASNDFRKEY